MANAGEAASLMAQLEGAGTWQVEAIIQKSGDVTVDLAWDGMAVCFVGRKAVFTRECISYGTDEQTVIETLGEYPVDYKDNKFSNKLCTFALIKQKNNLLWTIHSKHFKTYMIS